MSYSTTDLVACPTLQTDLIKAAKIPDPSRIQVPSPLTEYLNSPVNKGTLKQEIAADDGKIRTIRVKYQRRPTAGSSAISYNAANPTCTATTIGTDSYTDYTIDPTDNIQTNRKFTLNTVLYSCTDTLAYMQTQILNMVMELDQAAYAKHATQSYALAGKYGTDVTGTTSNALQELVVKTRKDSSVDPYAETFQEIEIAALQSAYTNPYAIFGGTTLWSYAKRVEQGCCASNGLDLAAMFNTFGKSVSYDRYVQNAMGGQTYNLMIMNGALQIITFNMFAGPDGINSRNVTPTDSQRVITSPWSGLPMDLMMKYDCGTIHMVLTLTSKVVGLPSDMFSAGDLFESVKFVNRIKVTNV